MDQKVTNCSSQDKFKQVESGYIEPAENEASKSAGYERMFLFQVALIDFLHTRTSQNRRYIVAELELRDFCRNELSLDRLCWKILHLNVSEHGVSLKTLRENTIRLQQDNDFFNTDELREVIGVYIKPIAMQEKQKNDVNDFQEIFIEFLNASQNFQSFVDEVQLENFCLDKLQFKKLCENIMRLNVNTYGESLIHLKEKARCLQEENHFRLIDDFKNDIRVYLGEIKKRKIDNTEDYLRTFINLLSTTQHCQIIVTKLELANFCSGKLSIDKLCENIMSLDVNLDDSSLKALQEKTEYLQRKKSLHFIDQFAEVLSAYSKPVELQVTDKDNRKVIEVTGRNIVISEILQSVENLISENPSVEEVRFYCDDILHINADLRKEVWHGKNVSIYTKKIKIHNKVTWDVSGKDENHVYASSAGTGEDGHGKQGLDGYAGESGGNILILTEEIANGEKFTIISNGGKGSQGQDGGKGKNGEDGHGITRAELGEKIPSAVSCVYIYPIPLLLGQVETIRGLAKSVDREWSALHCRYINVTTNQGNEITYSHTVVPLNQSYLFYGGSLGKRGGYGGEYGLGGQGGYAGEIVVKNPKFRQEFNITQYSAEGDDGKNGLGGLYGYHGRNGWDMGYLDFQFWSEAMFCEDYCKYKVEYFNNDNSPSNRVWCGYKEKYVAFTKIEHVEKKIYEERKTIRQNNDRKHHALAGRKKNIPQSTIQYSHQISSTESILQNLRSRLENNNQQARQEISENQVQVNLILDSETTEVVQPIIENQEQQSIEIKTERHVPYKNESQRHNDIIIVTPYDTQREITNVDDLINRLANETQSLDEWFQLKDLELSLPQLNQLIPILNAKTSQNYPNIEKLLINKYKFAKLQEIAKQTTLLQGVTINPDLTHSFAERYFIDKNNNDNNISHPTLGTLNQYLFENSTEKCTNITEYCKEEIHNEDSQILKHFVRVLLFEMENPDKLFEGIENYHKKHEFFLEKQKHGLITFPESFNKLYDDCSKDESVLTGYMNYIEKARSLPASYLELLAHIFDVNIRQYKTNDNDTYVLQNNHNPSAKDRIGLTCNYNEFIQLDIDKNYLNLEEERKKQDDLYAKIFREIKPLKQKEDFDEYFENLDLSTNDPEFKSSSGARYLIEETEMDNNISHSNLGSFQQYLYEDGKAQREKISKFCKQESKNEDNQYLKYSLRAWVLEVGESEVHDDIKEFFSKYKYFCEKQEHGFFVFQESFSKIDDDCSKNESVFAEYLKYIEIEGPLLDSYIELLAFIFNINIRVYQYIENELFLRNSHNPSSKETTHVLRGDGKFKPLNIVKNYSFSGKAPKNIGSSKDDNSSLKDMKALYNRCRAKSEGQLNERLTEITGCKSFYNRRHSHEDITKISPKEEIRSSKERLGKIKADKLFYNIHRISENEGIKAIIEYFPDREKYQLKERLEKITFQYTGQQGTIHNIHRRFLSEGRHVSFQELCFLVNSILNSRIEGRQEANTFCWIVSAYPQRNWIDELTLLHLENYFKEQLTMKSKLREYLSKINDKNILLLFNIRLDEYQTFRSISIQCIENILYLLSYVSNETISLNKLGLSEWPYALKEKYWSYRLSQLSIFQESEHLTTATFYVLSMENIFDTHLVEKFLMILKEKDLAEVSSVRRGIEGNLGLIDVLSNFHNETWNLNENVLASLHRSKFSDWIKEMQQKFTDNGKERDIIKLVELLNGNSKEFPTGISNNLPIIVESTESIRNKGYLIDNKSVHKFTEGDIKIWAKRFKNEIGKVKRNIKETCTEMLAVIDRAIELKRKFKLRDTQKLGALALLTNSRSTLAQVSTGEGKSLIVVASSIMKALYGEKVHIITSSLVLAKRDANENKDIYNLFDINVSHICSEIIDERKAAYSGNQILYGDLSNFQRDYLLDRFYGKNILGDHKFGNVIVDEVDSMLLDNGNNMLYLSHDLAGFDKLESLYIYIWQSINRLNEDDKDFFLAIKAAVVYDLYGVVSKEDMGKLSSELNEDQRDIIFKRLIKAKILDDEGKLLTENIKDHKLDEILAPDFSSYQDRLRYLLENRIEREKHIHIPSHLMHFVEQHLESWINSAIIAFFMKVGHDYVVDVDRTGTSPDRNANIIILDRGTGTDLANSQWDEAIHQFLQLKHGCKLSLQSLKTVFISNVTYFKLYNSLYGLTGTLGSHVDRVLLQEIHNVDFVTIPTAKCKQFYEVAPIICTSKPKWKDHIYDEVQKLTQINKRSVLIICETVNDVEYLYKAFKGENADNVHTYTRDYEEFNITEGSKVLKQGQIIIATNLAGRGTDIKITDDLRKAGGLHVCLTYLPSNMRIEQQAFGRAARCGDQGSGQLIILDSKEQECMYNSLRIFHLKRDRNAEELRRISEIKDYYQTQIVMEEKCFDDFSKQHKQLKKDLDNEEFKGVKDILLQTCLVKWAFWLDENRAHIKDLTNEQRRRNFEHQLNQFIAQIQNFESSNSKNWLTWVDGHPTEMIKLGKYFSENARYVEAFTLFDKVIEAVPNFSEAAHYYKTFALANEISSNKRNLNKEEKQRFKKELREASRLLDEHIKFSTDATGIIGYMKKLNNRGLIQINGYEEQQKNLCKIYSVFVQSINDILGDCVTPQTFVNCGINETRAKILYEKLLKEGILKSTRVKKRISEEELRKTSLDYGLPFETLKDFLSKYQGKEININQFGKALKKELILPSRELFWKLLLEQKFLKDECKYVLVDNEKLKEIDSSLPKVLSELINEEELKQQTLECTAGQILFEAEETGQGSNIDIFEKDDFINAIGKNKYQKLKKEAVLSFNRKANIEKSKINSVTFSCYDSVTLEDFTNNLNITKSEAERILANLIERRIIEEKNYPGNGAYGLKIKFTEVGQIQLPSFPIYENAVKRILNVCFTYRLALQDIVRQFEDENFPIRLHLLTKPFQKVVGELEKQKIIKPVTVAKSRDKNSTAKLVGKFIDELQLTTDKRKIKENIIETLERLKGLLEVHFGRTNSVLQPLTELRSQSEFMNVEEVHVFSLNGLNHLIQLGDSNWKLEVAVLSIIGICQVAIGAVMVIYSAGSLSTFGAVLMMQGISCIITAIGALIMHGLKGTNFNVSDLYSSILRCLPNVAEWPRFGRKVATPGYEFVNIKKVKSFGKKMIKSAGEFFLNEIVSKAKDGVVYFINNAGFDNSIERDLRKIVHRISLSTAQSVERHNISISLEEAYRILGDKNARKLINNLTLSFFTPENFTQKFLPMIESLTNSLLDVIKGYAGKSGNDLITDLIKTIVERSQRGFYIAEVMKITDMFLDELDQKIKDRIGDVLSNQSQEDGKSCEMFRNETIAQWKLLVGENVEQIMSTHFVSTIKNCITRLIGSLAKAVQDEIQPNGNVEDFENLKKECEENNFLSQEHRRNTFTIEDIIEETFKNFVDLLKDKVWGKTGND